MTETLRNNNEGGAILLSWRTGPKGLENGCPRTGTVSLEDGGGGVEFSTPPTRARKRTKWNLNEYSLTYSSFPNCRPLLAITILIFCLIGELSAVSESN